MASICHEITDLIKGFESSVLAHIRLFAAKPEPDVGSELDLACGLTCMGCTVLAVCTGLVLLFCRYISHADATVLVGLPMGLLGLIFETCF